MRTRIAPLLLAVSLLAGGALPALAQSPSPLLTVWADPGPGQWSFKGATTTPVELTVPAGDPDGLGFHWDADASGYGGTIEGYRMGWDLADPADPDDPGWEVAHFGPYQSTAPRSFAAGRHTFTVVTRDLSGAETWGFFDIQVEIVGNAARTWSRVKALFGE